MGPAQEDLVALREKTKKTPKKLEVPRPKLRKVPP